ncbi:hypothetical protein FRC01_004237 [Tulasnella sp. 417]|nr:hypothetical protein FRC01_004237 [Tulasnella sp. 417]
MFYRTTNRHSFGQAAAPGKRELLFYTPIPPHATDALATFCHSNVATPTPDSSRDGLVQAVGTSMKAHQATAHALGDATPAVVDVNPSFHRPLAVQVANWTSTPSSPPTWVRGSIETGFSPPASAQGFRRRTTISMKPTSRAPGTICNFNALFVAPIKICDTSARGRFGDIARNTPWALRLNDVVSGLLFAVMERPPPSLPGQKPRLHYEVLEKKLQVKYIQD